MLAGGDLYESYEGAGISGAERFIRFWYEVEPHSLGNRWFPLAHGGDYSPYYRPIITVIDWENNGIKPKSEINQRYPYFNGNYGLKIKHEDRYFQAGLSYGKRTDILNVSIMPIGCVFSHEGQGVFPKDLRNDWLISLGFLNSRLIRFCINQISGGHKLAGYLNKLPYNKGIRNIIEKHTGTILESVLFMQLISSSEEQNREFFRPCLLNEIGYSLQDSFNKYFIMRISNESILLQAEYDLNKDLEAFLADQEFLALLQRSIGILPGEFTEVRQEKVSLSQLSKALEEESRAPYFIERAVRNLNSSINSVKDIVLSNLVSNKPLLTKETKALLSYFIGLVFGRWDIRLIRSSGNNLSKKDIFEQYQNFSPGMLNSADNLLPVDYPLRISRTGILVDDESNLDDIEKRVRESLTAIWKENFETIEQEACQILGTTSLREYFRKPALFFTDHLKQYSKSRRQAPIYWPLSTPSGSYTLWLYYHRLTNQTLFTCVNDFVDPKLKQVGDESARLRLKKGRSTAEEKELERLTDFERELKDFRDELLRVAKFWKPNLNDGVEISASPLWKLFQHKPWQKRLKETWQKLEAGEYDWAHLAYSIRPEQVREKCKTDKSLAIAHGLEALYVEPKQLLKKKKGKMKEEADADSPFDDV